MFIKTIKLNKLFFVLPFLVFCLVLAIIFNTHSSTTVFSDGGIRLPILMYHHILKDEKLQGKYVISPEEFESDLRFLKAQGYQTISIDDLIKFKNGEKNLPQKPIMLTFDDGYLSTLVYALPILEKYEAKAVVSVVGSYTDRFTELEDISLTYGHMTWENVATLDKSPLVEVISHSYNMHNLEGRKGAMKNSKEIENDYHASLMADLSKMQSKLSDNIGKAPAAFTYPFGLYSAESQKVIDDLNIEVTFGCGERINVLNGAEGEMFNLGRYNRSHGINIAQIIPVFKG